MLITKRNFDHAISVLSKVRVFGFDTETYCLPWWQHPGFLAVGVRPGVFSMQFYNPEVGGFYFDFHHSADKLGAEHFAAINRELTSNPENTWFIHNAKFDLHQSANHGVLFAGTVHCTKGIARVINNLEPEINLDALCSKYFNEPKIDVLTEIREKGYATKIKKLGRADSEEEILHFDRLPLETLVKYGERDTELCYKLGIYQLERIRQIEEEVFSSVPVGRFGKVSITEILNTERELTKALFEMEREGVKIDMPYTQAAYDHEKAEYTRVKGELDTLAAAHVSEPMNWLSPKQLKPLFDKLGETYSFTEKGNACFDKDALEDSTSEVAKLILKYRFHYKRAHTYFENFLWLADTSGILHCDFQQGGPQTGRLSCWSPNLQNVPKRADKAEKDFPVRRCFVPKHGCLASVDWDAMEYRLMLDYAGEERVASLILQGLDPHETLGNEMGMERDNAKTMQFRILYGAGGAAIGKVLGGDRALGLRKKREYFDRLPNVARLIRNIIGTAETRGYIYTWAGRLLQYERNTAYKSPNGLIQGGCGDCMKRALVKVWRWMKSEELKSKLIITVHDELVLDVVPGEERCISKVSEIMGTEFPFKILPLTASPAFSKTAWNELQEGLPN